MPNRVKVPLVYPLNLTALKSQSVSDIADEYLVTPTFVRAVLALPACVRVMERVQTEREAAVAS
ncbi:MAG TPA: hypothetical protein GX507_02090 [Clostridia bacterium]|nr:hypothetical protein [Clostridia bacterium]